MFRKNPLLPCSADHVIAQIDVCRQLLFNRTEITRKGLQEGTVQTDIWIQGYSSGLLLAPSGTYPAEKLNSALNNFISEIEKLPEGENIAKEARDLFDLTNVSGDETPWQYKMFRDVYLTWNLVELDGMENFVRVIQAGAIELIEVFSFGTKQIYLTKYLILPVPT